MFWFRKKKGKRPEEIRVLKITFVREQDGGPERELKQLFIPLLEERGYVHSAYLARVTYENQDELHVALCIRMNHEEDTTLKKSIGNIFFQKFNQKEHLDILFISKEQEEELKRVCQPFYNKMIPQNPRNQ